MTWIIYTRLTAHNRAAEALVALFCLFWAALVARGRCDRHRRVYVHPDGWRGRINPLHQGKRHREHRMGSDPLMTQKAGVEALKNAARPTNGRAALSKLPETE